MICSEWETGELERRTGCCCEFLDGFLSNGIGGFRWSNEERYSRGIRVWRTKKLMGGSGEIGNSDSSGDVEPDESASYLEDLGNTHMNLFGDFL